MRERFVSFMHKGERIVGTLHIPDRMPAPAVIFCHGFDGNRIGDHRFWVYLGRELCKKGFIALRFDFRGCGESDGSSESVTISEEMSDLKAAISWLQDEVKILEDRIGVVGHSLGGVVAILTAAEDERIKAVCTISSPSSTKIHENAAKNILKVNIKEFMEKGYLDLPSGGRVWRSFMVDALKHDILGSVAKISPRPILIVHGTEDEIVPVSHAEELFDRAGEPKEKLLVQGANHSFNQWDKYWLVVDHVARWLEENLR